MRLYHFLDSKWALDDLQRSRLKISLLEDMNDPFELLAGTMDDKRDRAEFESYRHQFCALAGALCFSSTWHDPLLWSHYADRHRGVCLAFDINSTLPKRMRYNAERLPELVPRLLRGSQAEQSEAIELLYSTKFKRWEYESEWRLFATRNAEEAEGGIHFLPLEPQLKLKRVLLGVRFNSNVAAFQQVLREKYKGSEILHTRMAFKSYRIVRQKQEEIWRA